MCLPEYPGLNHPDALYYSRSIGYPSSLIFPFQGYPSPTDYEVSSKSANDNPFKQYFGVPLTSQQKRG